MKARNMLIVAAALAVSSAAIAWPGEPPPELNDCSPGFFKNHVEYWSGGGLFCSDAACEAYFLDQLTAKGSGSGDVRQTAASALNRWADDHYGAKICT